MRRRSAERCLRVAARVQNPQLRAQLIALAAEFQLHPAPRETNAV